MAFLTKKNVYMKHSHRKWKSSAGWTNRGSRTSDNNLLGVLISSYIYFIFKPWGHPFPSSQHFCHFHTSTRYKLDLDLVENSPFWRRLESQLVMNAVKIDFLFFRPTDSIFSLSAELLSPIQFPSPPLLATWRRAPKKCTLPLSLTPLRGFGRHTFRAVFTWVS